MEKAILMRFVQWLELNGHHPTGQGSWAGGMNSGDLIDAFRKDGADKKFKVEDLDALGFVPCDPEEDLLFEDGFMKWVYGDGEGALVINVNDGSWMLMDCVDAMVGTERLLDTQEEIMDLMWLLEKR